MDGKAVLKRTAQEADADGVALDASAAIMIESREGRSCADNGVDRAVLGEIEPQLGGVLR